MATRQAQAVPAQGAILLRRDESRSLPRAFFERPPLEVAPDLLGRILVRLPGDGTRLIARISETEAYDEQDPASHSFCGRTLRNEVMFGPAGHLYVYFTYGMHFCMNVVTGAEGEGSAVLLRAARPLEGLEEMAAARGTSEGGLLCSGPARLAQAFGVDRVFDGLDLVGARNPVHILRGIATDPAAISRGPRVGISRGIEWPWRFWIAGEPFISKTRSIRERRPEP